MSSERQLDSILRESEYALGQRVYAMMALEDNCKVGPEEAGELGTLEVEGIYAVRRQNHLLAIADGLIASLREIHTLATQEPKV